ncbi:MAG: alkaline phosphatase [Melioribacteraceae bacterium]|nr:alkaline phosphatase [Melioribacteraceae bacterium]
MRLNSLLKICFGFLLFLTVSSCTKNETSEIKTGSVIFIHPDGAGAAKWGAFRMIEKGPDSLLNWDKFDNIGLYRGHILDAASTSSNAGATIHAFGIKADYGAFGINTKNPIKSLSGKDYGIMVEAQKAGMAVGVINSGHICEPGSAVFLANAANRNMTDTISEQIIKSGAEVILSGGETLLLPEGEIGKHGKPGVRKDGKNIIKLAEELGYTVVYTRDELLKLSVKTEKVLGVFAAVHTFNDLTEEELAEKELPLYNDNAPSLAEMTDFALKFLKNKGKRFFLVVEEEGSDNFSNHMNASGAFESLRRADESFGTVMNFIDENPNTMLITCSDSEAGGLQIASVRNSEDFNKPLPDRSSSGAELDGINGTNSLPFIAKPDKNGREFRFGVSWATSSDVFGAVLAKTYGLNSNLLKNNTDNTDIYRIMYATLFGKMLP